MTKRFHADSFYREFYIYIYMSEYACVCMYACVHSSEQKVKVKREKYE